MDIKKIHRQIDKATRKQFYTKQAKSQFEREVQVHESSIRGETG